jgi:hypothetical protein
MALKIILKNIAWKDFLVAQKSHFFNAFLPAKKKVWKFIFATFLKLNEIGRKCKIYDAHPTANLSSFSCTPSWGAIMCSFFCGKDKIQN